MVRVPCDPRRGPEPGYVTHWDSLMVWTLVAARSGLSRLQGSQGGWRPQEKKGRCVPGSYLTSVHSLQGSSPCSSFCADTSARLPEAWQLSPGDHAHCRSQHPHRQQAHSSLASGSDLARSPVSVLQEQDGLLLLGMWGAGSRQHEAAPGPESVTLMPPEQVPEAAEGDRRRSLQSPHQSWEETRPGPSRCCLLVRLSESLPRRAGSGCGGRGLTWALAGTRDNRVFVCQGLHGNRKLLFASQDAPGEVIQAKALGSLRAGPMCGEQDSPTALGSSLQHPGPYPTRAPGSCPCSLSRRLEPATRAVQAAP